MALCTSIMSKAVLPGIRMSNRTDRVHVESVCVIPPIFFATFAKPLAKGTAGGRVRRLGVEELDPRHRRLLRARRERPRGRATDKRDDIAPTHVEHGAHSSHFGEICPIAAGKSLGRPELYLDEAPDHVKLIV